VLLEVGVEPRLLARDDEEQIWHDVQNDTAMPRDCTGS
jgi:hypothetical protein